MTGHTRRVVNSRTGLEDGWGSHVRTFLETGMSSETNLMPHIAHSVRTSNLRPVIEEVLYLHLFGVVNRLVPYNDLDHNNLPFEQLQRSPRKSKRPRREHFQP
jgi:hypothetical protein